jgi:superfamily II DNA/RNA helicase
LHKLLEKHVGPTLVFTRTKHGAKKVMTNIRAIGINAAEIHSNRSLSQRREALDGFKSGKYRVLVATDIASRGIDVKGIELVLNYDLPTTSDDYVHRIGRTARAGAEGHAITFAMTSERRDVMSIERLIKKPLPISKLPADLPHALPQAPEPRVYEGQRTSRPRYGQQRSFTSQVSSGYQGHNPRKPYQQNSRPTTAPLAAATAGSTYRPNQFGNTAPRPTHGRGSQYAGDKPYGQARTGFGTQERSSSPSRPGQYQSNPNRPSRSNQFSRDAKPQGRRQDSSYDEYSYQYASKAGYGRKPINRSGPGANGGAHRPGGPSKPFAHKRRPFDASKQRPSRPKSW